MVAQAGDRDRSPPHTINVASLGLLRRLVRWACSLLGLLRPETPRLAQLGFLIVAGFLLVNKVYSPQYVLWLLPLAVLARPRWRDQIIWQAGEVLYFAAVWWYLGGFLAPAGGGDAGVLLGRHHAPDGRRALPRSPWSPATCCAPSTTRSGLGAERRRVRSTTTRSNAVAV